MLKKGRKTLQGFLAALLMFAGVVGGTAEAADVSADIQRPEASMIAYEIPIEELTAAAGTELVEEEIRIGAKTSDMMGVQDSIFRYAYSAMLAAMLFGAEMMHMQKKEKEGE